MVEYGETQRFTQPGLWLLILGSAVFLWYLAWRVLVPGWPVGGGVVVDAATRGIILGTWLLVGVGLPLLFVLCRLRTEVRPDGLYVRFTPFHRRFLHWSFDEIAEARARSYSPIREYGGWGVRHGPSGRAYNVAGNLGVQLVLRSGERILIGTRHPDRLHAAIRRRMTALLVFLSLGTLGAVGCDAAGERPAVGVRDSAGVTIVVNDPARVGDDVWRIDTAPAVRLGAGSSGAPSGSGSGAGEFHRVAGAHVADGDGAIVVGDGGSGEIRWFDRSGTHVMTAGGEGEGPGEFRDLGWIGRGADDTVLAWDRRLRRLSVFRDGRFVDDVRPPLPDHAPYPVVHGVVAGDVVIASPGPIYVPEGEPGVQRPPMPLWLFTAGGSRMDTLGPFAGTAVSLRPAAGPGWIRTEVPFGATTLVAAGGSAIAVGDNDRYEVRVFDAGGTLKRIVRVLHERRPVTDRDVDAELERRLEALPPVEGIRAGVRTSYQATPAAEFKPAFDALLLDRTGHLWVRRDSAAWDVFDGDGILLGRVTSPAGLRITEIGEDYVLGVHTDELDVERVGLHRLTRPLARRD